MRIGIVTTWFERGAAYVSRIYMNLLKKEGHEVYIFARGGNIHESQSSKEWNESYVTRSTKYQSTKIEKGKMRKWLESNKIECVFFNEQHDFSVLAWLKEKYPEIKIGGYVDYYTENTIPLYMIYDFLICNTHRHMQAMAKHPQKYYVEWGTDVDVYKPVDEDGNKTELVRFFHSAGMSPRKGTDILVQTFIEHELYKKSKLIIHTQVPCEKLCAYKKDELESYGITVIEKTVTPPGLYHLGDVYVYPTRLDGLGLTMYEALSCGLPVITSDFPPMNEVGNDEVVKHIRISDYYCRGDAYYFPMCICDKDSLAGQMLWFVEHKEELDEIKKQARLYALEHYDIRKRAKLVSDIFENSTIKQVDKELINEINIKYVRSKSIMHRLVNLFGN